MFYNNILMIHMPVPQFKVRKVNGVTEIKLADDPVLRREFPAAFPQYAPLLSELSKGPTFEELKKHPRLLEFVDVQFSAGKTFTFQLEVRAEKETFSAGRSSFWTRTGKSVRSAGGLRRMA
jgi:hypothetical protein